METSDCKLNKVPETVLRPMMLCQQLAWSGLSLMAILMPGCGTAEQSTSAPQSASSSSGPAVTPAAAEKSPSGNHRRNEIWTDEKGQKWFGKIPMDVFFDEPYSIASNQSPSQTMEPGVTDGGNTKDATKTMDAATASGPEPATLSDGNPAATTPASGSGSTPSANSNAAGSDWGSLIAISQLDEEVKAIRNFLTENLQSVGNYNSSMLMIPPRAATLAMLAGVAMEHPDTVSWKADAKYIRDLASKMNATTLQRGPKDQKRLLALCEAIADILNRSRPADLEEPPEGDSFAETAAMAMLMTRMEDAQNRMKTEAGTESALGSRKEMVQLEAALLGTMAKTITLKGYGYEDDSEFKGFAAEVVNACQAIRTAADSGDFGSYESALTKVSTACNNCHMKYRSE